MNDFSLPARMDKVIDDVGVGSIIKHLETDQRGIVADIIHEGVDVKFIVVLAKLSVLRGDEPMSGLGDYDLTDDIDVGEWLVLTRGGDELLIP
jgi:hypothetical protein